MSIRFRRSTRDDKRQMEFVFNQYFGKRPIDGVFSDLDNRYIVACEKDTGDIVGFAGVISPEFSEFQGYEIDWSCVLPEYHNTSLLMNLLLEVTKNCDRDVYCESWRVDGAPETDLLSQLKKIGFKQIVEAYRLADSSYSSACLTCNIKKRPCQCCYDLYVLKKG